MRKETLGAWILAIWPSLVNPIRAQRPQLLSHLRLRPVSLFSSLKPLNARKTTSFSEISALHSNRSRSSGASIPKWTNASQKSAISHRDMLSFWSSVKMRTGMCRFSAGWTLRTQSTIASPPIQT